MTAVYYMHSYFLIMIYEVWESEIADIIAVAIDK